MNTAVLRMTVIYAIAFIQTNNTPTSNLNTQALDYTYNTNTSASHLEAWSVAEVSLRRLGVVESSMAHCTTRSSDGQFSTAEQVTRSVPIFGSLIHYLWGVRTILF